MDQSEPESIRQSLARQLAAGITVPLLVCASLLLVVLLHATPLVANDFWMQIKVGEIIRETGEIPDKILFAYGDAGEREFLAFEWMSSVGISFIHSHFGTEGAVLVRVAIALLIFALLVLLSFQINRDFVLTLFIAMASFLLISGRLYVRAEMFSFVLGLVELNLLQAFIRTRDRGWLIALLPLAVLWANLHGSFLVGIAFPLIFAGGEFGDALLARWRAGAWAEGRSWRPGMTFAVAGLAMAVVSLINPFGFDLVEKVLTLSQSDFIRSSIVEWEPIYAPAFVKERLFVLYALYLLLVADSLVQGPTDHPLRFYLLTGIFLLLSFDANRHVPWFAIAGSGVLARSLARSPRLAERRERNVVWLATVLLMGCLSTLHFGNVWGLKPGLQEQTPLSAKAIEFIRGSGYSGNVFNSYVYGSKLAYYFYPDIRITIDDRIDAYGEDYYRDFQRFDGVRPQLLPSAGEFIEYFETNELNLIVVRRVAIRAWQSSGRLALLRKAGWIQVYRDPKTWILRREKADS